MDFAKETKNTFWDLESGLGFFPKKCTLTEIFSQLVHRLRTNLTFNP